MLIKTCFFQFTCRATNQSLVTFKKKTKERIGDEDKAFQDSLLPTFRNFNQEQKLQF